jgi:hypothetical protein
MFAVLEVCPFVVHDGLESDIAYLTSRLHPESIATLTHPQILRTPV